MKRKYSKRTEVRSSYDAYKAWYTQYSKNHEMGSKMLSKKAFDKNYQLYKADGIKYNIAKTMAAD